MNTKRNRLVRLLMHGAHTAGIKVHYLASFRRLPRYYRELATYRQQAAGTRFDPARGTRAPILSDYDAEAGIARGHYFHQDLWAARRIFATRPRHHMDIGSRVDGFAAHVLSFIPLTIVDIRPLERTIDGPRFSRGTPPICRPSPTAASSRSPAFTRSNTSAWDDTGIASMRTAG